MENEKMSTDTSLRLEKMFVTDWQLNPDGSESMTLSYEEDLYKKREIMEAEKSRQEYLDKCKQILENNNGNMITIDAAQTCQWAKPPEPEVKECDSISVKIFIAGDYNQARKVINDYCFKHGLCVNVVKTTYIYSAGEEHGVAVELINYPRFPKVASQLKEEALTLAKELRQQLNQDSFTIQCIQSCFDEADRTQFYSWRHLRGK